MKFNIKYSKIGNLFFFISNLSEWSSYCRKPYNNLWLKNNPLKKEEKEALNRLRDILKQKKYNLVNRSLISSNENEFWQNISKILSENQIANLTESLNIFSERFEKVWLKEEKNLKKIKDSALKGLSISDGLIALIKKLYGFKKPLKSVNIFLFINPIKKRLIGGGSGFGAKGIGIECSYITKTNNKNEMLVRIILHEITHAYFEERLINKINKFVSSKYFESKYQEFILKSNVYRQTGSILGPIKELILVSLLPEGYLAEKFFGLNVINNLKRRNCVKKNRLEKNYYDLMLFGIFKMYKIAKDYSDNEKFIDDNYIEEAIKCWIEFENADLRKLKI